MRAPGQGGAKTGPEAWASHPAKIQFLLKDEDLSLRMTTYRKGPPTDLPLTLGPLHLSHPSLSLPSRCPYLFSEISPHSTVLRTET